MRTRFIGVRPVLRVAQYAFAAAAIPLAFAALEVVAIVGSFLDPAVRGAAYFGLAWLTVAVLAWITRFRHQLSVATREA